MRQIGSFGEYLFLKPGHWINTLALFVVGEGPFAIWGHENIFKYLTLTLGNRFEPVLGELGWAVWTRFGRLEVTGFGWFDPGLCVRSAHLEYIYASNRLTDLSGNHTPDLLHLGYPAESLGWGIGIGQGQNYLKRWRLLLVCRIYECK